MRRGAESYRDRDSCNGSYAFARIGDGHEIGIVPRQLHSAVQMTHYYLLTNSF